FFCQAEDGIRDRDVTVVQTCALPILELAMPNITELEIDELIEEIEDNIITKDIRKNVDMSNKLHNFLINKSGNKRLKKLLIDLRSEERRVGKEGRSR